jgi:hypothetical protein
MVADPAAIAETTPEALTVATAVLLEDQAPPAVASLNAVVDPTQILVVPVMAATVGRAFTVTPVVTAVVQPLALVTV